MPQSTPATQSRPSATHRGRLFRKYLLLILTLVTGALLASGAISVYFSYQENKAALAEPAAREGARRGVADRAVHPPDRAAARLRRAAAARRERRRAAPHRVPEAAAPGAGGHRHRAARRRRAASRSPSRASAWTSSARARTARRSPHSATRSAGKPWFGPVYFRKETEPYMTIAIRSGGDTGPVTVADVNLKFIWDVVSRIKIGDKGKAYVVDGNGFLVADPDIGLVLRKTEPVASAARQGRASTGRAPTSRRCSRRDLAGTEVLTSVAPIEPLGWNVFVEQPVAEVYAKLNASIAAHRAAAARRPRDLGARRAGARARHGAPDPHARRGRAAHRRGRPRPEDRRPHRRRAGGARRPVQPDDGAAARVVRGPRAQGRGAHAASSRIRSSSRRRSARSCA